MQENKTKQTNQPYWVVKETPSLARRMSQNLSPLKLQGG